MSRLYLISDGYYREEYPAYTNMDNEKFYSCQYAEQKTSLLDFLGENLWNEVFVIAQKQTPEAWEADFLKAVQDLMVWMTAKAIEDFGKEQPSNSKVSSFNSKIEFYKGNILDMISSTTELQDIQGTDQEPNRQPYNAFPTYFYR